MKVLTEEAEWLLAKAIVYGVAIGVPVFIIGLVSFIEGTIF